MKHLINLGLLLLLLTACSDSGQGNSTATNEKAIPTNDTIVGSKTITNEIPGSAYNERATGYFVVVGKDTSDFTCYFIKLKKEEGGPVGMSIRFEKRTVSYRQRMNELRIILPVAAREFEFDSLTSITIGGLTSSGDLAIDITNHYRQLYGTSDKIEEKKYKEIGQFLAKSKLGADLDSLFKPFSISVDKVFPEKLYFTTKEDLYRSSKIETDSAKVPDKILDCLIWVRLTRK